MRNRGLGPQITVRNVPGVGAVAVVSEHFTSGHLEYACYPARLNGGRLPVLADVLKQIRAK